MRLPGKDPPIHNEKPHRLPVLPSAQELQQLVAPIALYPDALVAQVLAGSTYPTQIVEAARWMEQHHNLQGQELAKAVDQQIWDPSVKALTEFPQVLDNMNKNLSWTSALGDAYVNNPKGVMSAVQVLRKDAQQTGNLKNTPQQNVSTEGQTIVIEPANPEVVYVPTYSPDIYGVPVAAYPGYTGMGSSRCGRNFIRRRNGCGRRLWLRLGLSRLGCQLGWRKRYL
jgi:hypothetical protein